MYLIDKINYVLYVKTLQGLKMCHDSKAFSKNYVVGCQTGNCGKKKQS